MSVSRRGNSFTVEKAEGVASLVIRLDDRVADLDSPVSVSKGDKVLWKGKPARTIAAIAKTLEERDDPALAFDTEVLVKMD